MLAEKRETSPPIFVFRITYFCPSWKRPSPCFQYVKVVLIRQPSQNIHTSREASTFCRRFRTPYVFWSSSSPCWRDSRSGITIYLQQAQSLIPYNYIPYIYRYVGGVQQSVLVEYCVLFLVDNYCLTGPHAFGPKKNILGTKY